MSQAKVSKLLSKYEELTGKELSEKTGITSCGSNVNKMVRSGEVIFRTKKNHRGQNVRYYR